MELLRKIIFEYVLGFGFQGFSFVLGIYLLNRQKVILKKYLISSILFSFITYMVRLLPISFGVHTILNILFLFLICIIILKMPAYPTIRSVFSTFLLLIISEVADVTFMISIFGKKNYENMINDPINRAITAIPANILFLLFIILISIILNTIEKKKGDSNGKTSI